LEKTKMNQYLEKEENPFFCYWCGGQVQIPNYALSMACPHCGREIDLQPYEIETPYFRALSTLGEVTIRGRGVYSGPMLNAGRLVVDGVLDSEFNCRELIIEKFGQVLRKGRAGWVHVPAGSKVRLDVPLEVRFATVSGHFELPSLNALKRVIVMQGGMLQTSLSANSLEIERGAIFEGGIVTNCT
jgi:hypothetical protein